MVSVRTGVYISFFPSVEEKQFSCLQTSYDRSLEASYFVLVHWIRSQSVQKYRLFFFVLWLCDLHPNACRVDAVTTSVLGLHAREDTPKRLSGRRCIHGACVFIPVLLCANSVTHIVIVCRNRYD